MKTGSLLDAIVLATLLVAVALVGISSLINLMISGVVGDAPAASRASIRLDVLKVASALVAGLGAAVAITVAYRRQRDEEDRHDGERFEQAASQLGHADAAVRIAGVYALGRLADESDAYREQSFQLLCAYLRLNRAEDGPVQQTICETISARLGSIAEGVVPGRWSDLTLDLHGVTFTEVLQLSDCIIGPANFSKCTFKRNANFVASRFAGHANFNGAKYRHDANFYFAQFQDSTLLNGVTFRGTAAFYSTVFRDGLQANSASFVQGASFDDSRFENGVTFSNADFHDYASFAGCYFGRPPGRPSVGTAHQGWAYFRQTKFGFANFAAATFETDAIFDEATMDSHRFEGAEISGTVSTVQTSFGAEGQPEQLANAPRARRSS